MDIFIKNMVCDRCIASVKNIFKEEDIHFNHIELGLVKTEEPLTTQQLRKLQQALLSNGFEMLQDATGKKIEQIKKLILKKIQTLNISEDFKLSAFLSEQLHKEYSSISKLFSQTENITLEQYFILLKIEKVKELLVYNEHSLTEIAYLLGYKTVQHLSAQFKKITGFSPTQFLKIKEKNRKAIDKIR